MIANLPLLFANGHPTALSKITAEELERFITFMVTCSWGHDTAKEIKQPPWWPPDVGFSHPFRRSSGSGVGPATLPKDWAERLKRLVRRCYDYHKSAFLLVFSSQLSRYPRRRLRYVDNRDRTTSLYYEPSGKLLVTFRNENLTYDASPTGAPPRRRQLAPYCRPDPSPQPFPQSSADIYLCDHCDSHFDNLKTLNVHEKLCNNENIPLNTISGGLPEFLNALKLKPVSEDQDIIEIKDDDVKPRIIRNAANIDRGPPYPFSSLAYQRNAKNIQRDTSYSRERIERYCCDSSLPKNTVVSKLVGPSHKSRANSYPIKYRRPVDYWHRKHCFPDQRKKEVLDLTGQLLLLKCRPITVKVEKMAMEEMQEYIENLNRQAEIKAKEKAIEFVGGFDCEAVEEFVRESDPLVRGECEVIDLCSDSEEPTSEPAEKMEVVTVPAQGVACVMRGGAVLRRAARSPHELAAEPTAASALPAPLAVLQPHPHPHPVILFTQTINNLTTISID